MTTLTNLVITEVNRMPIKTNADKQAQKRFLLAIGKKLMLQYGIKKTTVDDIVTEAQIAKGTFYLYFTSKEDFFYQLIVGINRSFFLTAQKIIQETSENSLQSAMRQFFNTIFTAPELTFYFREHVEIMKLTAKFSQEDFTELESDWIRKLLNLGHINTKTVQPEIIHNYIHIIYMAKSSDLLITEYKDETIHHLIDILMDYIFQQIES